MTSLFKKTTLAIALGASALTIAAPAQAQRYDGGYRGRGGDGGTALVAGVAGLAIGAAIASGDRRGEGYYEGGYRGGYGGGYYPAPVYRGPPVYRGYDGYYDDRRGDYRHYRPHYRDGYGW